MSGVARHELVAAAHRVGDVVRAHADDAERERRLPAPLVAALTDTGLLRMGLPAVHGGPEADPVTIVEAIEAVAQADGAAGWCTMIGSTSASQAFYLPPATAAEMFADPTVVVGGVFAPNGRGAVDGDTIRVTGRWQWGSGTQHCRWIVGGTRVDDETFRLCWFDATDVTFHDTWHASGLRGTGSLDFSVDDVAVPVARTFQPGITRPQCDGALGRFPNFSLLGAGVAAVALGIGRHALDELVAMAAGKRPLFSSRSLADSPYTQIELATAEAGLRSARAFLLDELETAWSAVVAGDRVDVAARAAIRLAAVHATQAAVAAADTAYTLAGGTSVYATNPLQRCLRDAHVVTQHLMVAPKLRETLGKVLLGLDADTATL